MTTTTTAARCLSAAVVCVAVCGAETVRAQGRDVASAETLFMEGRALMSKGRYEEACPKLEASQAIDPALGTTLNLGECYEKIGRTASAWLRYREAAAIALEKGSREREAIARDRAAALEPRLCRIVVRVAEQPEISVTRDGTAVPRAAYGSPVPVDPGAHTIEARAAGGSPFTTQVDVKPPPTGACAATIVDVPVVARGDGATVAPSVSKRPLQPIDLGPENPPPAPREGGRWQTMHTLAVIGAAAGIVGVGIGSAFGLSASATKSDADAQCVPAGCTASGKSLLADAGHSADASTIAFTIGGVLLVTGVVLWIASPSLR